LDGSDDEVLELGTVSNSLSAEDVSEDADDEIVGVVLGVLDDSVGEEELNSNILEAVGGKEEGNTVPLDDISEDGLGLGGIALVKHGLSLLEEGEEFNLEGESLVLNKRGGTDLSSSSLASISGLMRSNTLATQSSCLARASYFSRGFTARMATIRQARRMIFINA
jgi:hypothetical protein